MGGHGQESSALRLGSVNGVFHEKTAKKHQEQANPDEGKAECGQKTHSDEQRFHGRRDVLRCGAAEI